MSKKIGQALIERGLLNRHQLSTALQSQLIHGGHMSAGAREPCRVSLVRKHHLDVVMRRPTLERNDSVNGRGSRASRSRSIGPGWEVTCGAASSVATPRRVLRNLLVAMATVQLSKSPLMTG